MKMLVTNKDLTLVKGEQAINWNDLEEEKCKVTEVGNDMKG